MYTEMKTMACRFSTEFESIFGQVAKILEGVQADMRKRLKRLSKEAQALQGEALKSVQKSKEEVQVKIQR
jgi:hypothetical protein